MVTETPDQERIKKLKADLCGTLQESNVHINSLLQELENKNNADDAQVMPPTLLALQLELEDLENRANFVGIPNPQRCAVLARRLGATVKITDKTEVFQLDFAHDFPAHLNHCQLYFPSPKLTAQEIIDQLQQMEFEVIFVISLVSIQQKALHPHGEDPANLWVIPNINELTALLLSPEPIAVFIKLLSAQLKISQISPYQTTGAVQKDTIFFGRTQIIAQIMNLAHTNYLLIGGRQLGKSSILKHIARRYQNNSWIICHYMVLSDHKLQPKLAKALNLPENTDLSTLFANLVNNGKRHLFLIDEADRFIRKEITEDYPILRHFRALTGEEHCHFIFAGFWNLYEAVALDFQSPLRNFGEQIHVGELETEACQQLATEPMQMLGINYDSEDLVKQILEQTGQQANLIAIVCAKMLNKLGKGQRTLTQENVEQALQSRAVEEALIGYGRLTDDKQAAGLDRIIVYLTVEKGNFTLMTLMDELDKYHYTYTADQLKESLTRLELAFIICREGKSYRYCVPLFQQMLIKQDLKALLRAEGIK